MYRWLAHLALRRHRAILLASGVILLLAVLVLIRGGTLSSGTTQGIESEIAQQQISRELAYPGESSFIILFKGRDGLTWRHPRYRPALTEALAGLRQDPRVRAVLAPDDAPQLVGERLISEDGNKTLAVVTLRDEYFAAAAAYPELRNKVRTEVLEPGFTGHLAYRSDLDRTLAYDVLIAELVSLPLALLVLIAVFRTVTAAALSVGVGALAVVTGIAAITALSRVIDIAVYAINVASLIGLGVAIDYSLFIVSRYRDELANGASYADALVTALDTAGHAVVFSGFAVAIGLGSLMFFHGSFLATMGIGGTVVVLLAVIAALTFLPALLVELGPRINSLRLPLPRVASFDGMWHRIATWVMRRPILVLLPTLLVVMILGSPFVRLDIAAADIATLPRGVEARDIYEELRVAFPEQAQTQILVVATYPDAPAYSPERIEPLYELAQRLAKMEGVVKVEGVVDTDPRLTAEYFIADSETPDDELPAAARRVRSMTSAKNIALLIVRTDAGPTSPAARELVRQIRENRRVGDGTITVTGAPANDVDLNNFILSRAPYSVGFVLIVTYIVLYAMLRSVVLPLKAVIMNLLSIAASFGALVWIFEEGHLSWLLRFEPGPLDAAVPVLLFCAVFGLSMDYEVLMLSRMREEYLRTGDNTWAVAEGLERTGRLVTSAALIMVMVFGAFGLARVIMVKSMGIALAAAVALDATLVRVLIVPATMRLFGDFNWWAPKFLGGVRPRIPKDD
ncbi:MAG TPA: MMPL family transporter [Terriglobales bacterium]|nr:MMPL family transporter [Terriglobales bacterium]